MRWSDDDPAPYAVLARATGICVLLVGALLVGIALWGILTGGY